ncbi:MAG: hypothetical protein A2X86_13435 [Bdellovibrionales bacterium GWA2_49_15]|nr:MAG: hypothetical protein A2X86_13435 [Bdellovibrionales bacterium GWA2_49_15]HAZ13528.1 hypothetical protein [Bdellovibrionales bacterium]
MTESRDSSLDDTPTPAFSLDCQYRYTFFNSAHADVMKTLHGMEIQLGHALSEYYPNAEDWKIAKTHFDRVFDGVPFHTSSWTSTPATLQRNFETRIFPIYSKTGEVIGISVVVADNSERQRGEERHTAILQTAMDGYWLSDKQGWLLEVNNTYCSMSGYSTAELLNMHITDFEALEAPQETDRHIQNIMQRGEDRFETQHKRKDGSIFDVEVSVKSWPTEGGKMISFIRDITEAKRVSRALRESEYFFKESQRAASIGSYKADFLKDCWESSEVLDQILGIDHSYQRSIQGFFDIIHPEDTEMVRRYLEDEVISQRKLFDREFRIIRKSDGALRWVRGFGEGSFDNHGVIISIIGTILDITKQRQVEEDRLRSETQFRLIFENASDGILIADTRTKQFVMGNNKIFQMLKYDLSELQKLSVADIHPKEELPLVLEAFEKQHRQEGALAENLPVKRKDGSIFFADINAFPLKINGKEMLIGFFRDITERKRAEKEKLQMQEQLLHSSKLASIGTLAAGIAHEINNPLAIITGSTDELLRKGPDLSNEDNGHALQTIQDASVRIGEIVQGLKTYARQDSDALDEIDGHRCIRETLLLIQGLYKKENIKIEPQLKAQHFFLKANRGKLQQVIMNILGNAKDALMSCNERDIRITTQNKDDEFHLTIWDNGPGIPEHRLARIFDPFYTTKEVGKGTGLGLSISHAIITSFGGRLSVESTPGQGTTFSIILPKLEKTILVSQKVPQNDGEFQLAGQALVVDDEKIIRDILSGYLSSFGLDVVQAENGEIAYQMIAAKEFDFVFVDLQMPKMSGDELLVKIKVENLGRHTKFLVITGNLLDEFSAKGDNSLGQKVDAYLHKPFKRNDIIPVLKRVGQTLP